MHVFIYNLYTTLVSTIHEILAFGKTKQNTATWPAGKIANNLEMASTFGLTCPKVGTFSQLEFILHTV